MAKKTASKKAPAKKPAAKKPVAKKVVPKKAADAKKPTPKKAPPAKKPAAKPVKPAPAKSAPKVAAPAPVPAKRPEPAPVMKPVFESPPPSVRPATAPTPPVVMNTGAGGATSLTVSSQASAGAAANGNTHPANILVLVSSGGWPVTDLTKDNFTLMEYFEVPGQLAPFSNNITSFRNVGTGAYLLQVKPISSAPWRSGHHLAQILVSSSDDRQGQGAVKIIIR